jgi:K(+)-stimulated pyrophosphate-energized sodium pump
MGIAQERLAAEGYGEQSPVTDNATEEGRALNRRISLRVTRK